MTVELNKEIIGKSKTKYKVVEFIGSGGQGSVWLVKSNKEYRVLKILNDSNKKRFSGRKQNILELMNNEGLKKANENATLFNFILPTDIYTDDVSFGYFMDYVPKNDSKHLGSMIKDGFFNNLSLSVRYEFMKKLCDGLSLLNRSGLCYQDLNLNNIFYNDKSGKIIFIDCDNIAGMSAVKKGERAYTRGAGWFMAPEVAYGVSMAAENADRYAMATLFFMILIGTKDSPYHGKVLYQNPPIPFKMSEVVDDDIFPRSMAEKWLVFIFDPVNHTNSISKFYPNPQGKSQIEFQNRLDRYERNWNNVPESLKILFYQAFENPLVNYNNRPTPANWNRALEELIHPKDHKGPITDPPIRKQPIRKQPIQKQPIQKQPIQKQPVQKQPVQKQPVQKQPVQKQPVQKQPVQKQPVQKVQATTSHNTTKQEEFTVTADTKSIPLNLLIANAKQSIQLGNIISANSDGKKYLRNTSSTTLRYEENGIIKYFYQGEKIELTNGLIIYPGQNKATSLKIILI